jgi:hypothetical protein
VVGCALVGQHRAGIGVAHEDLLGLDHVALVFCGWPHASLCADCLSTCAASEGTGLDLTFGKRQNMFWNRADLLMRYSPDERPW